MNLKKSLLAVPVVAALGLSGLIASQSAQAYVYAGSKLDIANLGVVITSPGGGAVGPVGYGFSTGTNAELNGNAAPGDSDSCGTSGTACSAVSPVLSSDASNAPGSGITRLNTDYALSGNNVANYGNSNSEISTAQLVQGVLTSVSQVSEANVVGSGGASGSTSTLSNTNLAVTFQAAPGVQVALTFTADLTMFAEINNGAALTSDANAQYSVTVTASLSGGGNLDEYKPGALNHTNSTGAGTFGGVEIGDPSSITFGTGGPMAFAAVLVGADCGGATSCLYTLNLAATTGVVIRNEVPEPGTLALLSLGLLGASRLRKLKR